VYMLKITPLAFDSFGARSMATYLETDDVNILIDPSVALGPRRFGLPPHPLEIQREKELWRSIKEYSEKADVIIVTHYHYDHHNPNDSSLYQDKRVYIKHPKQNINRSQYNRAAYFLEKIADKPKSIEMADGKEYTFGKTTIKFSDAVFHGTNKKLGFVVEVCITCEDKFIHTSDIEGASLEDQVNFIIEEKPKILILDGPMTYMLGYRYSKESLEASINNIIRIIKETPIETIILEHHLTRDLNYKDWIKPVYKFAENNGVKVITAAEYAGGSIEMLEAKRKELHTKYGFG
ncbi:MAG: MBL fold metallo-hydrolase, partial [Methanosarcinales archaeon]